MIIGLFGLAILLLAGNMAFYELRVIKTTKADKDLISAYIQLLRLKKKKGAA